MPEIDGNVILAVASVLLFVGLIAFFAYLVRHQEEVEPEAPEPRGVELLRQHYEPGDTVEQPTPYWVAPIPASPDPLEIAGNLDKKIVLGAALLFMLFGLVGAYFLIQPNLFAEAVEHQLTLDVRRGKELYAQFCYDCHGRNGMGGQTPEGEQLPGPPLNRDSFKYENLADDPATLADTRDLIVRTITRGRENPPPAYSMPAWGREEGGPLGEWQIKQLADLIMYGADEDWADMPTIREHHEQPVAEQIPAPPAPPSGDALAQQYCASCHSFEPEVPSPIALAPNLGSYGVEGPLNQELTALRESGDPLWLEKWVSNAQAIKPGIIMPPFAAADGGPLDERNIRLIVEYLMELGTE